MLAAVAVVIMCLGGLIPVATYICPMLCCLTQYVVLHYCGMRLAWTWFVIVAILSLLFGPDKEATMVFLAVGFYPLLKMRIDGCRFAIFLKLLFFNGMILLSYSLIIRLMGLQYIAQENMQFGLVGLIVILFMGNATFLLLDKLLDVLQRKLR